MAWIESHQSLQRHPKLLRLSSLLKVQRLTLIGHLHCLWWWCLDYAQDGDLSGYDDQTVAEAAEWRKDSEAFVRALTESGWLDVHRTVHNWPEYAGKLLERRAANAKRMRDARAVHVESTSGARVEREDLPTNQPDRTVPTRLSPTASNGPSNSDAKRAVRGMLEQAAETLTDTTREVGP